MINLDSVLESRYKKSPTKVRIVKAMVFPVVTYSCESWQKVRIVKAMVFPAVTYSCESWTIQKAESQRIDVFKLWCWRRLLNGPWTARKSSQSILREINPEYSLEGLRLRLRLRLQYIGHLIRTADSLEKSLMLGKIERMRRGHQRMGWLDGITDAMDMNLGKLRQMVRDREA